MSIIDIAAVVGDEPSHPAVDPSPDQKAETLLAILDEMVDRALRQGATYTVHHVNGEKVLGMYDHIPRHHRPTRQITDELEASAGASWPLCEQRIMERTVAAGGVLTAAVAWHEDPVIDFVERYCVMWQLCPTSDVDEAADVRWNEEISELERRIVESRPTTRAGAISVLRFIAFKMKDNAVDGEMLGALTASIAILSREA